MSILWTNSTVSIVAPNSVQLIGANSHRRRVLFSFNRVTGSPIVFLGGDSSVSQSTGFPITALNLQPFVVSLELEGDAAKAAVFATSNDPVNAVIAEFIEE